MEEPEQTSPDSIDIEQRNKQEQGGQPSLGKWIIIHHKSPKKISSKRPQKNDGFPLRNNLSLPLWERILAWCQYASWYGPDRFYTGYVYENGKVTPEKLSHDPRTGFEFPPATEEQLYQIEKSMGFPHPSLLRSLYLYIANGGFGPGEGLVGIPGGHEMLAHHDPRYDDITVDPILFDLEKREEISDDPRLIRLAEREWPMHFLNLCRGDEEEGFYVHAKSGRVYLAGNAWNNETTLSGEPATTLLHLQANSPEEWFERWLTGDLKFLYHANEKTVEKEERYDLQAIDETWLLDEKE